MEDFADKENYLFTLHCTICIFLAWAIFHVFGYFFVANQFCYCPPSRMTVNPGTGRYYDLLTWSINRLKHFFQVVRRLCNISRERFLAETRQTMAGETGLDTNPANYGNEVSFLQCNTTFKSTCLWLSHASYSI